MSAHLRISNFRPIRTDILIESLKPTLRIQLAQSIKLKNVENFTFTFNLTVTFYLLYNKNKIENQSKYPVLQQHFIGWFIKSKESVFNPKQATFMDFSVAQKGNTRFMYVLPISKTEALLEYTLFSHHLLKKEEYETEIQNYIQKQGLTQYEIIEKEQGSIPMTCYPFWKHNTKNCTNKCYDILLK